MRRSRRSWLLSLDSAADSPTGSPPNSGASFPPPASASKAAAAFLPAASSLWTSPSSSTCSSSSLPLMKPLSPLPHPSRASTSGAASRARSVDSSRRSLDGRRRPPLSLDGRQRPPLSSDFRLSGVAAVFPPSRSRGDAFRSRGGAIGGVLVPLAAFLSAAPPAALCGGACVRWRATDSGVAGDAPSCVAGSVATCCSTHSNSTSLSGTPPPASPPPLPPPRPPLPPAPPPPPLPPSEGVEGVEGLEERACHLLTLAAARRSMSPCWACCDRGAGDASPTLPPIESRRSWRVTPELPESASSPPSAGHVIANGSAVDELSARESVPRGPRSGPKPLAAYKFAAPRCHPTAAACRATAAARANASGDASSGSAQAAASRDAAAAAESEARK
mmetsp:Transcript_4849/g.14861  ORF Transcript_4849/g.14861 Transcript_4849/m.14861 type:complete len:390 (-) Transcript_4849:381-1550(-)